MEGDLSQVQVSVGKELDSNDLDEGMPPMEDMPEAQELTEQQEIAPGGLFIDDQDQDGSTEAPISQGDESDGGSDVGDEFEEFARRRAEGRGYNYGNSSLSLEEKYRMLEQGFASRPETFPGFESLVTAAMVDEPTREGKVAEDGEITESNGQPYNQGPGLTEPTVAEQAEAVAQGNKEVRDLFHKVCVRECKSLFLDCFKLLHCIDSISSRKTSSTLRWMQKSSAFKASWRR